MNLWDAIDDGNKSGGQPNSSNPVWPGQPAQGGIWPGGSNQPAWPAPQPNAPGGWPAQPVQPNQPAWPAPQPNAPGGWPAQPNQPAWPSPQPNAPGGWSNPSPGPASTPSAPQTNLAVPFNQSLPSGVYDKLLITFAGTIKPGADKITVDLSTSHDLAMHLNPRFNEGGHKVIVRNSYIGKKWGHEERELKHFPFVQGQPFEIKILCTNSEFKVSVNNSHLLSYRHRITDLRSINKIRIYNDLTLSRFNMETLH